MKEVKLQVFIEWLVENDYLSLDSAASYDSYVRNACSLVNIDVQELNTLGEVEDVINYLSQPNVILREAKSSKTISNYKSGLRMYAEFLNDTSILPFAEFSNLQDDADLIEFAQIDKMVYDRNDLYKNFNLRLTTQDRFYEDIYFPISVIKQLLYKNGERDFYDAFIKQLLDNAHFHISKGIFTLKDLSELGIENGEVTVLMNGEIHQLLTPTPMGDLIPFNVETLKSISLDHLHSQYNIMYDLKTSLPMFNHLTNELKQVNPLKNRTDLSAYKKLHGLNALKNAINLQELKQELLLIASKTQLQLMDRSMNTSKGKKLNWKVSTEE